MKKALSVRTKLATVLSILAGFLLVLGSVAIIGLHDTNKDLAEVSENVPTVTEVLAQQESLARARLKLDRLTLSTQGDTAVTLQSARDLIAESDARWKHYLSYEAGPYEKELAEGVNQTRTQLINEGLVPMINALARGEGATVQALAFDKVPSMYARFSEQTKKLSDFQVSDSASLVARARKREQLLSIVSIFFGLTGLISAIISWRQLAKAISLPLADATKHFEAIERGDLTSKIVIARDDELGKLLGALENMQKGLRSMVSEMSVGAREVAEVASNIAEGNGDLSKRTEEQAASLEETAASMEQLSSTVTQNARNAQQASSLAMSGSKAAELGAESLLRLSSTMNDLKDGSGEIAEITSLIEGIAFQTNILALNAAVEAARAGEQGKGFAVVANEVRALAQKSGTAAREIKELIDSSLAKVSASAVQATDARAKMDNSVEAITAVSGLLQEIAQASKEQAQGVEQITVAVSHMDEVTQRNATLVEKSASAANVMSDRAKLMQALVDGFRVDNASEYRTVEARLGNSER